MRATMFLAAFLLSVSLLVPAVGAGDIIEGVVTAVTSASLQIDTQTYVVTNETVCQDKAGRRVAMHELHTGMAVEAEVHTGGTLGVVTVDLLR